MRGKWYSEAVRDLFRQHCEENNYSGEDVTRKITEYYYRDPETDEAVSFFDEIREDIQRLRYKPRSKSSRDLTFENKGELIDWVVPYLMSCDGLNMDRLLLTDLTKDIVLTLSEANESEDPIRCFLNEHVGPKKSYKAFVGKNARQNFPKNLNYKINVSAFSGLTKGILCELTSMESAPIEGDHKYNVYKLFFYESKSNDVHNVFKHQAADDSELIELIGVLVSSQDNLFVFKERYSQKSFMAKCQENCKGDVDWVFMSSVPEFSDYFIFKKGGALTFPTLTNVEIKSLPAFDYYPRLLDGRETSEVAPDNSSWFDRLLRKKWISFSMMLKLRKWKENLVDAILKIRIGKDLNQAIIHGDLDNVMDIAGNNPDLVNKQDRNGDLPMFIALKHGRWSILSILLQHKYIDIYKENSDGKTLFELLDRSGSQGGFAYQMLLLKDRKLKRSDRH